MIRMARSPGSSRRGTGPRLVTLLGLALTMACAAGAGPASAPAAPTAGGQASAAAPVPAAATSPPPPLPLRIAWAAPATTMVPLWLAFEQGIFREQGLDAELVFLSSVRTDQGVITGDTPIGYGANVVATRLSGADIMAIAGV